MSTPTRRRRVASLVACLALMLSGVSGCGLMGDDTLTIKVKLKTSSGLFVGNDVGVLGVPVGEVTSIEPRGDHVLVTLEVDGDVKVPADAGAVVVSRSMATDRYVELTPVWTDGPTMEDGAVIASDRTRTPVEWDEVLGAVDTLAEGLNGTGKDGEPIKRLLDRTAELFEGNGVVVRQTITDMVTGTGVFAEHRDAFVSALDNLDVLTREIAANQDVARAFIANVAQAAALVDEEKQNLTDATESIAETIRLLGIFVQRNEKRLGATATRIEDLSARFLRHQESFSEGIRVLPVAMQNLGQAINDRGRLDVKLPFLKILPGAELVAGLCELLPADLCDAIGPDLDLQEIITALLGGGSR